MTGLETDAFYVWDTVWGTFSSMPFLILSDNKHVLTWRSPISIQC